MDRNHTSAYENRSEVNILSQHSENIWETGKYYQTHEREGYMQKSTQ